MELRGNIQNKVVVITGGARGIGRGMARCFKEAGAMVVIGDINRKLGKETARELSVEYVHTDVTSHRSVGAFVTQVIQRHRKIDVLVANAGRNDGQSTANTTPEHWEKVIALNLNSVFYTCWAAYEYIPRDGRIIITSSLVGVVGQKNSAAYAAAKGGIIAYVKALALEFAPHGITVNAIAPGDVDTPLRQEWLKDQPPGTAEEIMKQIPFGRLINPEEIGALAVFLASPEAALITGQTIIIDGGKSLGK